MDASVGFLLENLKQLAVNHVNLIKGAEDELRLLGGELGDFKAILEDASRNYKKDKFYEQWERQIREAVYDIEDTIDICITQATAAKMKNRFQKFFSRKTMVLAEEVKTLREKTVAPLMNKFQLAKFSPIANEPDTVVANARRARLKKSTHIVGFDAEAMLFVNQLTQESDKLEITSIIGMPGLGKTTFAWKIFQDSTVEGEFVRIWVNVSEKPDMKKVLQDIMSFFPATKLDASVKEEQLTRIVKGHLEEAKFLMVMDDIWEIEVWKELKSLLPTNNKWGRVLITTRNTNVGYNPDMNLTYKVRPLNTKESWELLQYEVFGKLDDVPEDLVSVGKDIATDCKGLPLSIVVMGGILQERRAILGGDITAIKNDWVSVSKRVRSYLVEDTKKLLGSIISLSYETLPYELRDCFLYLGVFPEDANIPIKKLIRLWIAEGFIKEGPNMEEVAHNNLNQLINRNLVMIKQAKPGCEAKMCHIHDSVREICKHESGNLNLFQEISKSEPRENIKKFRRLCIRSHALDFFSRKPKILKARSFLCFNEPPPVTLDTKVASDVDGFGSLRVYDAKNIKFPRFPQKFVEQLTHIRFLTLIVASHEFKTLPEAVTNLWNLQTLIVDAPSTMLEVDGDIWKMRHLRHFETHASIIFKRVGEGEGGEKLQTLSRLAPKSCTDEVCKKATNLLTLAIQGDLRILEESRRLGDLGSLNKLKLVHEVNSGGAAENPLTRLPDSQGFPPKLKILVLSGTHLDWTKMSIFSGIVSLEVLKLKENACQGNNWETAGDRFLHLVRLHIEKSGLIRWTDSADHFPRLKFLYINNCEKLSEIPPTLGKSLELLSLDCVKEDAVTCAKEIMEEQKKQNREIILEIADPNRQS